MSVNSQQDSQQRLHTSIKWNCSKNVLKISKPRTECWKVKSRRRQRIPMHNYRRQIRGKHQPKKRFQDLKQNNKVLQQGLQRLKLLMLCKSHPETCSPYTKANSRVFRIVWELASRQTKALKKVKEPRLLIWLRSSEEKWMMCVKRQANTSQ